MKFDRVAMNKRFWEITDEIESVLKGTAKLKERAQKVRDVLNPIRKELKDVNAEITKIEEPHIPVLKSEMAMLARALGTKVGPRPE